MRLTLKIALAILLGVALLFSVHSYLGIERERGQLKENLSREARRLGHPLRVMVSEIWQFSGEQAAIRFLQRSNLVSGSLQVRWVWVEGNSTRRYEPRVSAEKLSELSQGKTLSVLVESPEGHDFLFTYLPLRTDRGRLGAIEISESLDELHGYVEESLRRSAVLVVATVVSGLLLTWVLGSFWINRPVKRLAEQARRIGTGDFSTAIQVSGRDELAGLADTIDRMRGQLAEARDAEQAANQARLEALEKLRHTERLATLGRLSAGMAHELGTPLSVISGRARLIADEDLSAEDTSRSARIIGEQAERMSSIMRQLLNFARRGEARKQAVELTGLVKGVVELLKPTARKQGNEINWEATCGPLTVEADPGQLQQVLLNLAMNGLQAMPEGGRLSLKLEPNIALEKADSKTSAGGPWCRIRVEDQGQGIAAEDLPHIYDPFFTTKDVGQGTGLGLSITYGIVEDHGGWIDVDSAPGKGSRFSIYLPSVVKGESA